MRTRMAKHALHHPDGFDVRTAIILRKNGVLKGPVRSFRPDAEVVDIARDTNHPLRIELPAGPLVAHKPIQNGEAATVLTMAEFLYAEDADVRELALTHLKELATGIPPRMTRRTHEVLVRETARITSTTEDWQVAAVEILDAIDDDYLYNLAGLRQSIRIGYSVGAETFGSFVLRPPLAALTALEFATEAPSREHERIEGLLKSYAQQSSTAEEVCARYFESLGHLPLAAHLSLGNAMDRWLAKNPEMGSVWDSVWQWAEMTKSPLARYHVCQLFVIRPELIPEQKKDQLWQEILEVVTYLRRGQTGLRFAKAWRLRAELLEHYVAYFECVAPGEDSERIANLAFWATEQVAAVHDPIPATIEPVTEQTVAPNAAMSREIWQLTRPTVQPSSLRAAAHLTPLPWALALFGDLGSKIGTFVPAEADQSILEPVRETLTWGLVVAFPLNPPSPPITYSFEQTLQAAAIGWAERFAVGEAADALRQLVDCHRRLGNAADFLSELRGIPRSSEVAQFMIARAFRTLAYLGLLPVSDVRDCVWNHDWRKDIMSNASQQALNALWDGLAELQMQQDGDWSTSLPHFWASLCEETDNAERRRLLFVLTALSCLCANCTSGLRRLTQQPQKRFAEDALSWKARCQEAMRAAPPWPAARLRAYLAEFGAP